MIKDKVLRRGLSQSLEEYAAQLGCTPALARSSWRLQGLRALALVPKLEPWTTTLERLGNGLCRIAPGLACPTKPLEVAVFA